MAGGGFKPTDFQLSRMFVFSLVCEKRNKNVVFEVRIHPLCPFLLFLASVKKRKKYTRFFALKMKKSGFGTASMLIWSPILNPKTLKNLEKRQKSAKKPKKSW